MGKYYDMMSNELKIRGYSKRTHEIYLRCMRDFIKFHMKSPVELDLDDIKAYQIYLVNDKEVSYTVFNQSVCALRFFYKNTLRKEWEIKHIAFQKKRKKLPDVLSAQEVSRLINAPEYIKHKAIIQTFYSTGMRLEELVNLTFKDINSDRMSVRIRQGKGRKDRYVMLSETLLETLREYWKQSDPKPYKHLFPGRGKDCRIHTRSVQHAVVMAGRKAGLNKRVTPHLLRHCFGTHLLEMGVNIRVIQLLMGHRSLSTTTIYTHVAKNYISETPSPLDVLDKPENKKVDKEGENGNTK